MGTIASTPSAIEVKQAGVRFPGKGNGPSYQALSDVNLSVSEGEFICLLGPSGCGKTTLLNLIAGFQAPSTGTVEVFGKRVEGPSIDKGVVFQSDRAIFDWLTVEDNVSFGPRVQGLDASRWRPVVDQKLALVGLADHRHKLPRELSGGMKQRLQIARALSNEPDLLLMDEPFAALDAHTRGKMQIEVTRIWEATGKTFLFVTHDIAEAIWLADRIGIMTKGPGSFIKTLIDVPLPRPRSRMNSDFAELFNQLSEIIDTEAAF